MARSFDPLGEQIRKVLLGAWDPSNASRSEFALGEYDAYVEPIRELILGRAGEEAIIDYLMERQREIMCFPPLDRGPLRRPAQLLLSLRPA